MKNLLALPLIIMISVFLNASEDIETLAEKKCGSCHLMGAVTKEKINNIKAPPYWGMAKKVRSAFDNETDRINFIVEYTINPKEDKMLFPAETKKRFGLMPSQKGKVTEDEIRKIAKFFLDK